MPFCVVYGADGAVRYKGSPKDLDLTTVFDAPPLDGATEALAQVKISDLASPTAATAPALIKASPGTDAASPDTVVFGFGNDDEDF